MYVEQNGFARLHYVLTMYILAQSLLEMMMIELDYNDWCWVSVCLELILIWRESHLYVW